MIENLPLAFSLSTCVICGFSLQHLITSTPGGRGTTGGRAGRIDTHTVLWKDGPGARPLALEVFWIFLEVGAICFDVFGQCVGQMKEITALLVDAYQSS